MEDSEIRTSLERHHPAAYGWAKTCCRQDESIAEDVLQTAYWKILGGKARYGGQASFKTWLFSVIRRTAAEEWRRLLWRRLRFVITEPAHLDLAHEPPDTESLDRADLTAMFRRALASLSARQRQVLHLVFYDEMTLQEASTAMDVSVGSARQHYERGKARLRAWMANTGVYDGPDKR